MINKAIAVLVRDADRLRGEIAGARFVSMFSFSRPVKLPETFIAMSHLACGIITWRATGLLE